MAVVGGSIENPVNGERIEWIETAASTSGTRLSFDLYLRPGAAVAARHRHLRQAEHFHVRAGRIEVEVDGREASLGPGDEAMVSAGVAHRWWNAGTDEAIVRVVLRPALRTETFFETLYGLARDGKTNDAGIPGLLQIAATVHELGDSCSRLAGLPVVIQRVVAALLSPVARVAGRRATYERFSPRDAAPPVSVTGVG